MPPGPVQAPAPHDEAGLIGIRLLLILVAIAVVALFLIQNVGVVEIRFLVWSLAVSRSVLLFLVLCVGVAIGWAWCSYSAHRRSRQRGSTQP